MFLGHIGTVINIEKMDNCTKLLIHYDGWGTKWDEWVTIDHSKKTLPTNVKPLHTFTPLHLFLTDPHATVCKWGKTSKWEQCKICQRKFCVQCLGFGQCDRCKDCMKSTEPKDIFGAICAALYSMDIFGNYSLDIYVIHIIADYSIGVAVQCSNTIKKCQNDIHFDSKYDYMSYNWSNYNMYRYHPKYACDEGTHTIFGELTRIFCRSCTQNELRWCELCCSAMEARKASYTTCHNHIETTKCTLCTQLYADAGKDVVDKCTYCRQMHCTEGCMTRCSKRVKIIEIAELDNKLYYEYENVVGLALKKYNESKYKYTSKYKSKRSVGTRSRRRDKRANIKSKKRLQRRYQMSLQY